MKHIAGKRIWITGASGGLGERIAYLCVAEGAHVLLSARREDRLIEIKRKITEEWSGQCEIFPLDVGRLEDIDRVRNQIGSVDVLINNAGFGIFETVLDSTLDDMKAMFDVNVFGLIACTKAVLPHMLEQKRAISSTSLLKQENCNTEVESLLCDKTCRARLLKRFADGAGGNRHLCDNSQSGTDSDGLFSIADKDGDYVKMWAGGCLILMTWRLKLQSLF